MAIAEEQVFEVCPAMEAILHGVQGRILEQAAETEAPPTHVEVRRVIAAIREILDGSECLDPLLIQELARTLGMHSVIEERGLYSLGTDLTATHSSF